MLSLTQLLNPPTLEQSRQFMIDVLVSVGFKTAAAWQSGGLARTTAIEIPARILYDVSQTIATVARGGFNDTAEGDWLTLYSFSAYDNLRKEAVKARGVAVLTSESTAPPHTIEVDYLVATDGEGRNFRNKTAGQLPAGGTLALEWEAELAGEDGSISVNTLRTLQTTLVGVSINNPGVDGVWLTRLGANAESDEALRERNRSKWATRALHAAEDAYKNWALEASTEITRAQVDSQNPNGPGSLRIYLAGTTGEVPASLEPIVENYINGSGEGSDGIVRRAVGALVEAKAAVPVDVTVMGTVYCAAAYRATAEAAVGSAVEDFGRELPVGGVVLDPNQPGKLLRSALYGVVMRVPGVMNVDLQSPSADIELAVGEVAVLTIALQYESV